MRFITCEVVSYVRKLVEKIIHRQTVFYEQMTSSARKFLWVFKIKFPRKHRPIFRTFPILRIMEWRRFVTYLLNDPRIPNFEILYKYYNCNKFLY